MLSTRRKRIVFCGNWSHWPEKWNFLDGENSDNSYKYFIGTEYSKKYMRANSGEDLEEVALRRLKLNRIIDSSEYVVRCSHGKTSNPTSGFSFDSSPSPCYGSSTDIVGFTIDFVTREKDKLIKNHFNDLQIRFGIYGEGRKQSNRSLLKYYGSKMVASQMDEKNCTESWATLCNMYKRILDGRASGIDLEKHLERSLSAIKNSESILGQSLKSLSLDKYIEICTQIKDVSISYDQLKEMIYHKKWGKEFFEFKNTSPRWMKTDEERRIWMDWVKSNWHINRGLELIWMMMSDKRFEDYDKYIIGVMGINECFKISSTCQINQWGEYIWMSEKIKNKELLFLPDHIEDLYDDYQQCINQIGFDFHVKS